jgi:hypothetical protein
MIVNPTIQLYKYPPPLSPASGPATNSFSGFHVEINFLATINNLLKSQLQ